MISGMAACTMSAISSYERLATGCGTATYW